MPMKLPEPPITETALIEALRRRFGPPPPEVLVGIGDDCAAVIVDGESCLLWTVDTLMEGVHFDLAYTSLPQLGWKTLTVNLSDIAAMGGEPSYALLSLGWPPALNRRGALEVADGLARAAREYGVAVIGGDTVASPGGVALTLTLLGRVPAGEMLRRFGAGVGDLIYVTGFLGEAAAGLEILRRRVDVPPKLAAPLCRAHLTPRPQLTAGRTLARQGLATALIDLSDGVATDLNHICRAGGVGARLAAKKVPVSPHVITAAPYLGREPLDLALTGGEDFQLLFTSSPEKTAALFHAFAREGLPEPLPLGEIVAGKGVRLITDAGETDISGRGFDHFRP